MAEVQEKERMTGPEKAALLLVALGANAASTIMQQLSPDEMKALGSQIAQSKSVDSKSRESVLEEFAVRHKRGAAVSGLEYARQIIEQALGPRAKEVLDEITSGSGGVPFDWLKSIGAPRLAAILHNERPQVTALVLVYLSPTRAADIIAMLPEHIQGDVAYRLSYMQSVSPEVAQIVEDVLESKLSRKGSTDLKAVGGVNSLVAILNNADRATENRILEYLEQVEEGVAQSVREMMFVFDDIAKLDDHSMRMIIQEASQDDMRTALKGAPETVRIAFYKNMSERAADAMKEDIEMMGRVKLRDVETAQRNVLAVVRKLDEDGTISMRSDGEEFIA